MATEQTVLAVIRASRPTFKNRHDKAAFAVHATFVAAGYLLHATGPPAFTDHALSSTSTDEVAMDSWNEVPDNYAFLYSNPDKSLKKVLVKCLVMNDSLLVDVLKDGDSEPLHIEIDVTDYVTEDGGTNYGTQFKNLGKLVGEVNKLIIDKLDGSTVTASSSSSQPSRPESNLRDDRGEMGAGSYFPQQPRGGVRVPPIPDTGLSDLYPGPGAGMYPRGDFGGGGSMLIGPNDPRFFGPGIGGPRLPGDLPGNVPPGARFDPYGPPGVPGFEPNRFVRRPRPPGGGGLHPDLQHFPGGPDFPGGGRWHPDIEGFPPGGSGFI